MVLGSIFHEFVIVFGALEVILDVFGSLLGALAVILDLLGYSVLDVDFEWILKRSLC